MIKKTVLPHPHPNTLVSSNVAVASVVPSVVVVVVPSVAVEVVVVVVASVAVAIKQ
jgi:hypothetical protein